MKKRNIKFIQWTCRIIPILMLSLYFGLLLVPENETKDLFHNPFFSCIYILIVFSYFFLIFLVLPGLIWGNKFKGFSFYFISWFLAACSIGVVPIILYWIKVDKKLSEYISNKTD